MNTSTSRIFHLEPGIFVNPGKRVRALLEKADINVGGRRPWDIQVHDPRFFRRVLLQGSLGLGESYMEGWWDCERLDEMFQHLLESKVDTAVNDWRAAMLSFRTRILNLQTHTRAFLIGQRHYDIGDELFERMLDKRMVYSCAYWRDANDLEAAQKAKLDLVARKLGLERGMRVLDVGCGWGGAARYFAENHGVEVVGVTVSRRQAEYAQSRIAGLPVDVRLQDYRDLVGEFDGKFDRALSIGMFEHAGYRNYAEYFATLRRVLKRDGLFLLHTIGSNVTTRHTNPWVARYIFPNSNLPSIGQIGAACEGHFVMEDWHNFGADYDRTLMEWHRNFKARAQELPRKYDERFRRMWSFYLMMSAAGFRTRRLQLWQVVLSPEGVPAGYQAPR